MILKLIKQLEELFKELGNECKVTFFRFDSDLKEGQLKFKWY